MEQILVRAEVRELLEQTAEVKNADGRRARDFSQGKFLSKSLPHESFGAVNLLEM
jgi:hypothetical protein